MDNKDLFENIAKGSKLDKEVLSKAAKSGDTSSLINSLSQEDKQKLNDILADKEALSKVLNSPQAKALMKMFGKGNNNG